MFYPDHPDELRHLVGSLLDAGLDVGDMPASSGLTPEPSTRPRALIVPHAGYIYSGPVAASAYRLIRGSDDIRRVVLLGPSHHVPFQGIAVSRVDAYASPLGSVPLDRPAIERVLAVPQVVALEQAHGPEHSLEVHLPFLQVSLRNFSLVPLVIGRARPDAVADVLELFWQDNDTLIVVSSDLSHYLSYDQARAVDAATASAIVDRDDNLTGEQACGCNGINGLMRLARRHGLSVRELDRRNSGDTAGPRDRVVGYGAWVVDDG